MAKKSTTADVPFAVPEWPAARVEMWPLEKIKPYDRNPRTHSPAQVALLAQSMKDDGVTMPILVDEAGVIIAGHGRLLAATENKYREYPVVVARGWSEQKKRAARIRDNQIGLLSGWDDELLRLEMVDLKLDGYDMPLLGFDSRSLDEIFVLDIPEAELVPEPPKEPIVRSGDLWHLGEHRLLCGDATKTEDLNRLMDNERAMMMFTDPPWNVAIGKDLNPRHRQRAGLKNDDLSPAQFGEFLQAFSTNAIRLIDGDVYCVLGASEWGTLDLVLRKVGFHWSATIIWVKDIFVLGRSKYHRRYEPIWYGWPRSMNSSFQNQRDLDDVWEIARPRRSDEHPTMKPLALVERAVVNSSERGQIVLDVFAGAGSTMIACERTERRCRSMEIDPGYVQVCIERWQQFTGKLATLAGKTLQQIAKERKADAPRDTGIPVQSKNGNGAAAEHSVRKGLHARRSAARRQSDSKPPAVAGNT